MNRTFSSSLNVLDELAAIRDYVLGVQGQLKSGKMPDLAALEERTSDLCRIIREATSDVQQKCAPELKELARQLDDCEYELRSFYDTVTAMASPGKGMTNADIESISWLRVIFAFVAVFGLIAIFGLTLKYFKMRGFGVTGMTTGARRLQVIESLMLDPRRRLVIVRCDGTEHLLLLGVNQDIVVEANLDKHPGGFQSKGGV